MTELPAKFLELPEDFFPLTVEFYQADGETVHCIEIDGPGAMVVPPLGDGLFVRIKCANGMTTDTGQRQRD